MRHAAPTAEAPPPPRHPYTRQEGDTSQVDQAPYHIGLKPSPSTRGTRPSRADETRVEAATRRVQAATSCAQVDEAQVDKLLTRRWRLRKKLQYEEADLVREELEAMGVSVFDKGAMWHGPGFASCAAPGIRIRMPTLALSWSRSDAEAESRTHARACTCPALPGGRAC